MTSWEATAAALDQLRGELLSALTDPGDDLDDRTVLERVVATVVPRLADFCGIDLAEDRGSRSERIVRCAEWIAPGVQEQLTGQSWTEPSWRGHPLANALLAGDALRFPVLDADGAAVVTPDPERGKPLIELGLTSMLVIPLRTNGGILGTLVLASLQSERSYTAEDLETGRVVAQVVSSVLRRTKINSEHHESDARFATAFDTSPIGMARLDSDGRITQVNASFAALCDRRTEDLIGSDLREITSPFDIDLELPMLEDVCAGRRREYRIEKRLIDPDGTEIWVTASVAGVGGVTGGTPDELLLQVVDATATRELEDRLAHVAFHDPLTGLANRLLIQDRLCGALSGPDRRAGTVAVAYIDLDRFRAFNERLGHDRGDELLVGVSRRLSSVLGPTDILGRVGDDEFVVVCERVDNQRHAEAMGERLADVMATTVAISGMQVAVNISIGIAVAGEPSGDVVTEAEQMLADAQLAMRAAKSQVRSRFQVFDTSAKERAGRRVELEMELSSIDSSQMFVMFQPITVPVSGGVIGVEALLRWRHPRRGVLDANEFLLAAEDTGLIVPMGAYALETATAQLRIWDDEGVTSMPQWIAVNLSRRQIARPTLVETVRASLDRCGLRADRLCLEVSERVLNSLGATSERVLAQFAEMGVSLAIDDVGTAPIMFETLGRVPVQYIKLDPVLLRDIDLDPSRRKLVAGVIAFAHSLDCRVVAEGVEMSTVLDTLADLGCDAVQGHAVAPPLEADTITAFLLGRGGH